MPKRNGKAIAKFLYEVGQLKRVQRSGWWIAGVKYPESVAEHSFRAAIIGYFLAHLEGADPMRTAAICLFHDVPEARVNDLHRVARRYANWEGVEEQAFLEQTGSLPRSVREELVSLMSVFGDAESAEGRVAHDADVLECLIQAREYQSQGYRDVRDWIENSALMTESAKLVAEECMRLDPGEWWKGLKAPISDIE